MAVAYIAEYKAMVKETYLGEMIQAPLEPPVVEQTLAIGTVVASQPFCRDRKWKKRKYCIQ